MDKTYYVYAWYYSDTNIIFYIGKGTKGRYKDTVNSRNLYFKNIIKKEKENVSVKILYENITDNEACLLERKLIHEYWNIGLCKANFHEGGKGGYTGKYDDPERSRKLSIAASKRVGPKNSMYGKHHSAKAKAKISKVHKGKKLSKEHLEKLIFANTGRVKTPEEIEKIRKAQIGKIISKKSIVQGIKTLTNNIYEIEYNGKKFAVCLGKNEFKDFCKKELKISATILFKIVEKTFIPKFNRHKWINNLKINHFSKDNYSNMDIYFNNSAVFILDEKIFVEVKTIINKTKNDADIVRYGKINPEIRK